MRKIAIGKAAPEDGEPKAADKSGAKGAWFREHWRLVSLFVIIVAAFLIRFVFAYGISAADNYALSGGNSASSNLRIVTEILAGTYDPANQSALNYPFGSASVYGPLYDYVMAAFASVVSLFGVTDATAAAGTLAWSAPILGALTCIPVYMIGKKMFKDETIGVVSALFYAFFGLLIMTSPFSSGTGFAFVCFIAVWMFYFLVSAFDALDTTGAAGPKGVFQQRGVLKYTVLAAVFFALTVLSWTSFRMLVIVAAVGLAVGLVASRIGKRDLWGPAVIMAVVLLVGAVAGAAYYVPMGLWDAVFSGGFVLAALTAVFALAFAAAGSKPWVITVPAFIIAIVAVAAVIAVAAPSISSAVLHGNSVYTGSLMVELADTFTRNSISQMASYFGWLTVWFPLIYAVWMMYRYRAHCHSRLYGFSLLFILCMFIVSWFNSDYAVIAGTAFAVGSAALSVRIVRAVDMKSYFRSLRGNGLKSGAKKAVKFFPLVTLLVAVLLVAAPNAIYAVDAATPTNDEKAGYFGGLGYTIDTTDASSVDTMWDSFSDQEKSGAVLTWMGSSTDATAAGFDSVTDNVGGGTSVMPAVYLADSSDRAVAALALRLILAGDLSDFEQAIRDAGLDYDKVAGYINDPSSAVNYIKENADEFPGIGSGVDEENAVYLTVTKYIADTLSETAVDEFYDKVCDISGHKISYVEVDTSMIPVMYRDNSSFSTIAYFGDYTTGDYGAVPEFYTINQYTGYSSYKDAMYETFLWRALFGVSDDDFGESNSMRLLEDLSAADGDHQVAPLSGLSSFKIAYWHVEYNPDGDATVNSDGWEKMDAYEAIAKQRAEGGLIDYMSSVMMLEYDHSGETAQAGTVKTSDGDAVEGVKVAVYEADTDKDGNITGYTQRSTDFTDKDGKYSVFVPNEGDYYVTFYSGATDLRDGNAVQTVKGADFKTHADLTIEEVGVSGTVYIGGTVYEIDGYAEFKGTSSGETQQVDVTDGELADGFKVLPDIYNVTVYDQNGNSVGSSTVTVTMADSVSIRLGATSGTVKVAVTDQFGATMKDGVEVVLTDVDTGAEFTGETDDGTAEIRVPAGTFSASMGDDSGYVSVSTTTVSVESDKTKNLNLAAYVGDKVEIRGSNGYVPVLSAVGYMMKAGSADEAVVPDILGAGNQMTFYAVEGGEVYYAVAEANANSVSLTKAASTVKVTGTVTYGDDKESATVYFIRNDDGAVFQTVSGDDGSYTAYLPAGTYNVYATNGSNEAYLGSFEPSAENATCDVKMVKAYKITQNVTYRTRTNSSSTEDVAFFGMTAKINNGAEFTFGVLTDTDGDAKIMVPEGADASFTMAAFESDIAIAAEKTNTADDVSSSKTLDNIVFYGTEKDGDSDSATTYETYMKPTTVTNDLGYNIKLTSVAGSPSKDYTINSGESKEVLIGRYNIDKGDLAETGHYTSGQVTVYPGQTSIVIDEDVVEVFKVTVTVADGDKTPTVIPSEDEDGEEGKYYNDGEKDNVYTYYLEDGYTFVFKVVNEDDDDKVAYSPVVSEAGSFDLTEKHETVRITGFVGVDAEADITATFGETKLYSTASSGEYDITVPVGQDVTVEAVVDHEDEDANLTYKLKGSATITADAISEWIADSDNDGKRDNGDDPLIYNFSVLSDGENPTQTKTTVTGSEAAFAAGEGKVMISVKNTSETSRSYVVSGSSQFVLDQVYTLNVGARSTGTVEVSGHYNPAAVGAGSDDMSVTVSNITGSEVGKYVIPADAYTDTDSKEVKVLSAGEDGASNDSSSGATYKYAVTIVNDSIAAKNVTVNATGVTDGWKAFVTDSTGYLIYDLGGEFTADGLATTTVYVMLVNTDGDPAEGEKDTVPSLTITVSGDVSATKDVQPQKADLSMTSGSASNGGADAKEAQISNGFWVLAIISVLVLLALVYSGMKRGVFTRRK